MALPERLERCSDREIKCDKEWSSEVWLHPDATICIVSFISAVLRVIRSRSGGRTAVELSMWYYIIHLLFTIKSIHHSKVKVGSRRKDTRSHNEEGWSDPHFHLPRRRTDFPIFQCLTKPFPITTYSKAPAKFIAGNFPRAHKSAKSGSCFAKPPSSEVVDL